jgi:hypothetical protein
MGVEIVVDVADIKTSRRERGSIRMSWRERNGSLSAGT